MRAGNNEIDLIVSVPGTPEDVPFSLSDPVSGVPGTVPAVSVILVKMLQIKRTPPRFKRTYLEISDPGVNSVMEGPRVPNGDGKF
jgi:hypothetical protein